MDVSHYIFIAILASLTLMQFNQRLASPVLALINRWLRWVIFAGGMADLAITFKFSERSFWALAAVFFLVWALVETLYNWLAIKALSFSSLPLFPRFSQNAAGDEWPTDPRLLKIRDWLRSEGFKQVQSLKAEIAPNIHLRMSIYQDLGSLIRCQITFVPQPNGTVFATYSFSSETVSGRRFITDNLHLPFGGFYPENWLVERRPLVRSVKRLLARHRQRLAKSGESSCPWTTEPIQDINDQQQQLERVNTELGFLFPHAEREEFGKITHEGRYRVWKEVFLLNYLGRSSRYE